MTNRLGDETSPYLRQHADNPVDWWPWCDEALAHAREANRPILLSIGYAACHWCHVMAHESFEDEAVARVMNALYVNIKVDREERPDIDKVYQLAHQALARRGGGWPLTMFLDPHDLLPFFAGTYFPPAPRHGLPAFVQVLEGVRDWFERKPDEVRAQNGALQRFLAEVDGGETHAAALGAAPIALAFERIAAHFDADAGGRRGGPKFPHASEVEFLLSYARTRTAPARPTHGAEADDGAARADAMARLTLARMAERGLRDHVGGGFFRYCVDAHWDIPHFEKMLYDNAQLLPLYAIAARRFDDDALAAAAEACAAWLLREMQADEGGFFSSLDADSDGEEGRFYVWQRDEIRALLTPQEYAFVERRFGLDRPPNFEGHAWHLRAVATLAEVAGALAIDVAATQALWTGARATLARARSLRVRPGLDDKVLTAWNALAIGGGARAVRAQPSLHALRPPLERALEFLHAAQWQNGRLFASHARGTTQFRAYLDDHAFLLDALIAMLQLRWNRRDLDWAIALADVMLAWFADTERGGFYFTAHDGEALPQRPRPWLDESLPAGNGVAARALLALGRLVGDTRYLDAAERTLQAAWPVVSRSPEGACSLLLALEDFLAPRAHVILRVGEGEEASRWRDGVAALEESDADVFLIPAGETALPGLLDRQVHRSGGVAYLCRGVSCSPPIDTPHALVDAVREAP